jgi:tRNA(fMet)-specific endonuclease VapC
MADSLVLVDTDVFIWLTRGKDQAARYAPLVANKRIVLSFVTVAELWRGAYRRQYNDDSRRKLEGDIGTTSVIAPDNALTHVWAELVVEARAAGHALGDKGQAHDAWVAATARLYSLAIVTDDRDFDGFAGLTIVRPQ